MNIEKLLKMAYQKVASQFKGKPVGECLTEESIACFFDGKLLGEELNMFNEHILSCKKCATTLKYNIAISRTMKEEVSVPPHLENLAKSLISEEVGANVLDVVLNFTSKSIELIRTTGSILIGPELVPVHAFRSSGENDKLPNEVKVTKTLSDVIAEIGVEKQRPDLANIVVRLTEKETNKKAKEIRVSLMKGDRELQSSLIEDGKVKFEEVKANDYKIYLTKDEKKIGIITISITTN